MDFFHWEYYRELNPDLYWQGYETQVQCTQHYKSHGITEKRKYRFCDLFPDFDWIEYQKQNPTLVLPNRFAYEHHYFSIGRFQNLYYPVVKKIEDSNQVPKETIKNVISLPEEVPKEIIKNVISIPNKESIKLVEPPSKIIDAPAINKPELSLVLKDKIQIQILEKPKPKIGLFLTGWGEPYVQKKKEILLHNLKVIKTWKQEYQLDLYIYLYTPSCLDILREIPFLDYVSNIVIVPKPGIVGEFIYRDVSKLYTKYDYVILFLDDIEFSPHCSLDKLISIYTRERIDILALPLTVTSPHNYSFMLQDISMIQQGYTYRETNFAELFFYLLSSKNFKNYLKFFTNATRWCWGIDLTLYPNGIRIGIAETYPLKHYFKAVSYQKHLPDPLVELNVVCGTKVKIKDKVNLRKEKY